MNLFWVSIDQTTKPFIRAQQNCTAGVMRYAIIIKAM